MSEQNAKEDKKKTLPQSLPRQHAADSEDVRADHVLGDANKRVISRLRSSSCENDAIDEERASNSGEAGMSERLFDGSKTMVSHLI